MGVCSEWGGAESRGSRARPVELKIMEDTCTTHRSRVPRRSSGRIKGGATTVQDERGPGLDFNLCFVCGSRPWGAAALLLCLFMLLKSFEYSPVPASFFPFYELCYRVIEPIKWMGIIGPWLAMIDKGQWREFGQDTGVTPLLFTMSVMGFLMTTESQDLGLTSHPKDGALLTV